MDKFLDFLAHFNTPTHTFTYTYTLLFLCCFIIHYCLFFFCGFYLSHSVCAKLLVLMVYEEDGMFVRFKLSCVNVVWRLNKKGETKKKMSRIPSTRSVVFFAAKLNLLFLFFSVLTGQRLEKKLKKKTIEKREGERKIIQRRKERDLVSK